MTTYNASHTSGDLPAVVIDFIVEFGVQILAFAGLIALIVIFVWVKNNLK